MSKPQSKRSQMKSWMQKYNVCRETLRRMVLNSRRAIETGLHPLAWWSPTEQVLWDSMQEHGWDPAKLLGTVDPHYYSYCN